ncbi:MAG: YkgJ family cysteine cluster protein [Proteobacteria bacterium]|nr:YkgJ family cysteine cluster protein [Pseudomonadota bacterium]
MSQKQYQQIPAKLTEGLDRLSLWQPYSPGMCNGCLSYCCHLPVEATAEDMVRLGLAAEGEYRESPKRLFKKLLAQKVVSSFRVKSGLFTLAQKSDGSCGFLGADRRCTVYEKRPEVCRRFPDIGPRPGFCPARKFSPSKSVRPA